MAQIWIDVDAAVTVPVNVAPLLDDTDFATIETTVAYNAAGMDLIWTFVTTAGVITQTAVVPTTGGGLHNWTNAGLAKGMYKIAIPASGGTVDNDAEGFGYFTGVADGVLPWRGPTIGFRAASLNDVLIDGDGIGTPISLDGGEASIVGMLTKMADDNGGVTFDAEFDSLNKIQTNITTGAPGHEPADDEPGGGEVLRGTNTDNDSDATANDDGTYWQVAAESSGSDGFGFTGGLSVRQTFTLGTDKKANLLKINAKETLAGVVHVWAWNYLAGTPAFEQISDTGTAISGVSDDDFMYALLSRHQQASDGEVRIRYTSTDTATNKYLFLDQVLISYVAVDDLTAAEIADATASHDVSNHTGHDTFGFRAGLSMIDEYPITTSDTASSFTCSSLPAVANYYRYHAIRIHDVTGGRFADSWISSMDNAGVVTLGKALPFTPDTDSELFVMGTIVAPAQFVTVDTGETEAAAGSVAKISQGSGGGDSGSGARTVTVTVDDGATVLENATVRFTEGVNTFTGLTNVSGVIVFSLDDATYAVSITKAGYTFTPTTKIVNGTEADTYSMTAVSITAPPNAATTTGVMTVYDEEGSVESGVTITVQVIVGPGTAGIGYDSTEWAATSNGSGVVEFAGIILGARYKIWRGTSKPEAQTFTAPTTGTSFDLAEVIGRG